MRKQNIRHWWNFTSCCYIWIRLLSEGVKGSDFSKLELQVLASTYLVGTAEVVMKIKILSTQTKDWMESSQYSLGIWLSFLTSWMFLISQPCHMLILSVRGLSWSMNISGNLQIWGRDSGDLQIHMRTQKLTLGPRTMLFPSILIHHRGSKWLFLFDEWWLRHRNSSNVTKREKWEFKFFSALFPSIWFKVTPIPG